MENPRSDTQRRIFGKTHHCRDFVRTYKADAEYVYCQTVRIFREHLYRCGSVLLKHSYRISRAYSVLLQKEHYITNFSLLNP